LEKFVGSSEWEGGARVVKTDVPRVHALLQEEQGKGKLLDLIVKKFGGTIKAFCETNKLGEKQKVMAYFAGGLTGIFFAMGPGFSAEEHGCQVETGAAGCMAAAALVELSGGTVQQAVDAASMALQNCIGLICDPVADRVEVPCLGKNVAAGMNALSSSTMALAGFDAVIPLDQVLRTVERVGKKMPAAFCNTGKGGLAVTVRARELKEQLLFPEVNPEARGQQRRTNSRKNETR
jgi:L-serine dehydratase